MAAPLPHWKRKTRPCPFYAEGRCIFADACNFVHTATIDSQHSYQRRGDQLVTSAVPQHPFSSSSSAHHERKVSSIYSRNASSTHTDVTPDYRSIVSSPEGSASIGSARRKSYRISLRSPPRSPRLSGLLSALQSVIGPDVEEVVEEVYEDEEPGGTSDNDITSTSVSRDGIGAVRNAVGLDLGAHESPAGKPTSYPVQSPSTTSSDVPDYFSRPQTHSNTPPQVQKNVVNTVATERDLERSPLSPDLPLLEQEGSTPAMASFDESSFLNAVPVPTTPERQVVMHESSPSMVQSAASPRPASVMSRRPLAIDTSHTFPVIAHAVNSDESSSANDENTRLTIDTSALSPLPSPAPRSPFELLSSPFASPAKRMLASLPFPSQAQRDSMSPILSPVFRNFSQAMVVEGAGPSTPPRQRVSSLDSDLDSPAMTEKHRTPTFAKRRSGIPATASDLSQTPKPGPQDCLSTMGEGLPSPPALAMPAQLNAVEFWPRGAHSDTIESEGVDEDEASGSNANSEDFTSAYSSPTKRVDTNAIHGSEHSDSSVHDQALATKKHSYDSLDADDELAYAEAGSVEETEEDYDDQSRSSRAPSALHSVTSTSLSLIESEGDAVSSVMDFYSSDDPSPFTIESVSSQVFDVIDSDASGADSENATKSLLVAPYHSPVIAHQSSTESFTRSMTYAPITQRPPSTSSIISTSTRPSSVLSSRLPGSRRTSAIITSTHSSSPTASASEAEPPSSSSSNLSWEEVTKNPAVGGSKKVSFGFRHESLLLDTSAGSLTPRSHVSRHSSTIAPEAAPRRRSYTPGSQTLLSSPARVQSPSPTSTESPQSASSAPGPSRPTIIRPSSWMKPLRLSQMLDSPIGSESTSRSRFKRFSRLSRNSRSSVTTRQSRNVTSLGSPIEFHEQTSRPSTTPVTSPPPAHDISPLMLSNAGLQMRSLEAVLESSLATDAADGVANSTGSDNNNVDNADNEANQSIDLLSPLSGSIAGFGYDSGRSVRDSILVEHPEEEDDDSVILGEAISEDPLEGFDPEPLAQPQRPAFIQPAIQRDLSPSPEPPASAERTPAAITPSVSSSSVTPSSDVTTKLPIISSRAPSPSPSRTRSPSLSPSPSHLASTQVPLPSGPVVPPRARSPSHTIATPRPTLLFAIASDDPAAVERVLASGDAAPNDDVGPQSALEFALKNESLTKKTEIVKVLLAYGADPTGVTGLEDESKESGIAKGKDKEKAETEVIGDTVMDDEHIAEAPKEDAHETMNPAMKYYLERAKASQSAQSMAIRRSIYRPLARIRFDFVGQDRALEQLYSVLSMHSQQHMVNPLVVMCCGPSGYGKSLLARKFGSLLDVPAHTVNMTILQSSHDLWQCPSMSPYDPPSELTLAEFLTENQGKRCVVVLDEIDKNEDEKNLWSLLAPWELGRCSIDAGRRHIDVRNVIWIGTSNIGQDLIFEYDASRKNPDTPLTREEFRELMALLRPKVTEKMGTALMSRVTTVLPFVPFTHDERLAIAAEALLALGGDAANALSSETFNSVIDAALAEYVPLEGARSLYRSVSTHLMEVI